MSRLERQRRLWERHGKVDPLWAILTVPGKEGGRWKESEFFATGRQELARVLAFLKRHRLKVQPGRALDFGCGAGRLTQAMAAKFRRVDGVDISEAMIKLAAGHNRFGRRCAYHVNVAADLKIFDDNSFDFIYSSIVLQHNPPRLAMAYLREFLRVLKPGGLLCFQVPEARNIGFLRDLRYALRIRTRLRLLAQALGYMPSSNFDPYPIPMYAHPEKSVRPVIEAAGGRIQALAWNNATDQQHWRGLEFSEDAPVDKDFPSRFYVVSKDLLRPLLR